MAATQAEKQQQNDVNSEKVQQQQPDQQHPSVRSSSLQNGTDKCSSSVRGGNANTSANASVVVTKTKPGTGSGSKNLCLEMSQYRQDGGEQPGHHLDPELGPNDYAAAPSEAPPTGDQHHGQGYGFPFAGGREMQHNSGAGDGGIHAFGQRQGFGGPKPGALGPGPGPFPQQQPPQRFVSGQTLSQPTGPTPTLNQLLQSSNPMHRYPNNYEQSYNQGWPQKPYGGGGGGAPPGTGAPYRNQASLSPAYSGVSSPTPGYGEGRGGWSGSGPPGPGQHGSGSPGPPPSSVPASQPSPQPSQAPSHSPGPGLPPSPSHQPPPTQHQGFPNRPAQPTTPNAHAPDQADLSGGNSNDSSGGPAPGTPNSLGMRPTPSPTGSTGSRSMSPAVGQQNIPMPPRPSSGQSDGGSTRVSHSPMTTQGNYPPQHMHNYKGHPGMIPPAGQGQQMPMYQPNQYQQGAYPARPQYTNQNYGPPSSQPPPNNSMPPQQQQQQQYPNRSGPNHLSNNSQFPPYQQSWPPGGPSGPAGPNAGNNHILGKGNNGPPPPQPPTSNSQSPGGPPRPPHYLKQHLQHKMGFGNAPSMPPSPSPPQNYHMGPPPAGHHHSGMGPPPSMGPPNMPPATSPLLPNNHPHDGGPMPPPSSTPNSHHQMGPEMLDNGITTTAAGGLGTHVTAASAGAVTSVVTTGPDGAPIDEGSQQSTLSNASAASGDDPQCTTPKSRKNDMGHYSHPTTPQSTVPSPGAASMNSLHEEYELSSPSWPRTPASPVFNSHVPAQETYRSKKTDSLSKLYDMDDSPDRRAWLDKLLAFMEERRTPITTCPTISKNPLDLFRLYVYVKERGGFMEVTKNKTWKDIAGMLGIGASSSAAYTLRKHYTKNLLAYECQFDRGGIDPQPIINQVEASSKKKGAKAASVPSPGSSNSQDSFPAPGSGGASLDGYGAYGYPPGNNPDYNATSQRPSSQANAPSPHGGSGPANHLVNATPGGPSPAGGADNVSVSNPFDDVSPSPPPRGGPGFAGGPHPPYPAGTPPRPQGQAYAGAAQGYNQYPPTPGPGAPPDQYSPYPAGQGGYPPARPNYPPYTGSDAAPSSGGVGGGVPPAISNSAPPGAQSAIQGPGPQQGPPQGPPQDPYNRYMGGAAPGAGGGGGYTPRPAGAYGPPTTPGAGQPAGPPPGSAAGGAPTPPGPYTVPTPPPGQQEYYRPEQQAAAAPGAYPGGPPANKNMPPPAQQPRRHPDFAKDQQGGGGGGGGYHPAPNQYGQQQPPQRPQMYGAWPNNNQYRGPYPPASGPGPGQQWQQGGRPPGPPGQWDRYPASNQGGYQPAPGQQQPWSPMPTPGVGQSSPLRPPLGGPRAGKPFSMMPQQGSKALPPQASTSNYSQGGGGQLPKREIVFPPDSVEATVPVLYRRKRLCRADVGPVDAWRIIMALRSGLLVECCYALDLLTILLFDDSSVGYFGLNQWVGLLDLLLEHFRKSLSDMFGATRIVARAVAECDTTVSSTTAEAEVDLGGVQVPIDPQLNTLVLNNTTNYTLTTRKGFQVKLEEKNEDIFIKDHHRVWDTDDPLGFNLLTGITTDPWECIYADYMIPTFQAEFDCIPFHRKIYNKVRVKIEEAVEDEDGNTDGLVKAEPARTPPPEVIPTTKPSDKKRRTKTLSDVISRIKKETSEEDAETETETVTVTLVENVTSVASVDLNISSSVNGEGGLELARKSPAGSELLQLEHDNNSIFSVRDIAGTLKRRRMSDYEDEAYTRDEASLVLLTESQDCVGKRSVCISNILRSLTCVPGNESEFAKSRDFLAVVGKLLLLNHDHPARTQKTRNYDREEDADFADSCSSLQGEGEWWWDFLLQIRENVLVSIANIAGQINLSEYSEEIARPLLDGLLHWAICPSAQGQDPFPSAGPTSHLSPQRLSLEALCKLCVTNCNVDLVIATPPFSRLERLCAVLTKHLCRSEDQVLREFSINLLHYLAAADSCMARVVAMQQPCVSLLVAFIEQAEQSALGVANQHGIVALRDNPDSMGTSLDMLRRAASTLVFLAEHPDNRPLLVQQEPRVLALVMSQILDQQVALLLSKVLYKISHS